VLLKLQLGQAAPHSESEHTQGGLPLQHQQKQPLLVLQQHEEAAAFTGSGSVSPMGSIEQPTTPDASSLATPAAAGCTAGLRGLILPEPEPSAVSTVPAERQNSWTGLQFGSWGIQADIPAESGAVAAETFRGNAVLPEQLPFSSNVCCEHSSSSSSSSSSEALQSGSFGSGEAGTDSNTTDPTADGMQGGEPLGWLAPAVNCAVEHPGRPVAGAAAAEDAVATALHGCQVGSQTRADSKSPPAVLPTSGCSIESGSFDAGSSCGPAGGVLLETAGVVLQQQLMAIASSSTGAQQQPAWAVPQFGAFDDSVLDNQLLAGMV